VEGHGCAADHHERRRAERAAAHSALVRAHVTAGPFLLRGSSRSLSNARRCPRKLRALIEDLWRQEPPSRPSVMAVRHILFGLLRTEEGRR